MSKDNKRLGKGIEALFTANTDLDLSEMVESIETVEGFQIERVALEELRANPFQPRKNFDETALQELADSIKEHGIIQPLVVRKTSFGYDILAGERRYRAAKIAGLETVPVVEKDFDDKQMQELAILENIQREDLDVIEEARGYEALIQKFDWTQQILAERMGKSRSHITNILRLLTLPVVVQQMLMDKEISMGHARVLVGLEPAMIAEIAQDIVKNKYSVREVESLISKMKTNNEKSIDSNVLKKSDETKTADTKHVENLLTAYLGAKTTIYSRKMEIEFNDIEELNQILATIGFDVNE